MSHVLPLLRSESRLDRRAAAHDLWPRRLLERRARAETTLPAAVVWPRDDAELQALVADARRERYPLVPLGAASGVCGAISPDARTVMVDMKRMKRVLSVDAERRSVTVEAGMLGERLERALNARGFTLGHFPSSLYCSTVGGWVATRSAGQLSSRYGKIEDMVLAIEGVDGRGETIRAAIDDPCTGPGALRLLLGSEGALCIVTRVTLRIHPLSSHRWLRAYRFAHLADAIPVMQALMAGGEAPSVLRLYDPVDTWVGGGIEPDPMGIDRIVAGAIAQAGQEHSGPEDPECAGGHDEESLLDALAERAERLALFTRPRATRWLVGELLSRPSVAHTLIDRVAGACKLVIGLEGDAEALGLRAASLQARMASLGVTDAGHAPAEAWLRHRHRVSYRMTKVFAAGGWVDTLEVATGWEGVLPLYTALRHALRDVAIVLCHFSHAYVDGCSLYFTFLGGGIEGSGPRSALGRYELAWERALSTVRAHGAALSHHHGVGRLKGRALRSPEGHVALLQALKRALDPDGILNPGLPWCGAPASEARGGV